MYIRIWVIFCEIFIIKIDFFETFFSYVQVKKKTPFLTVFNDLYLKFLDIHKYAHFLARLVNFVSQ